MRSPWDDVPDPGFSLPDPRFPQAPLPDISEPDYLGELNGPQQPMPDDFWSRMAIGSGGQGIGTPQFGPRPTGLEVLIQALAGFANAKTQQAGQRVAGVQQQNKQSNENARALANRRWEVERDKRREGARMRELIAKSKLETPAAAPADPLHSVIDPKTGKAVMMPRSKAEGMAPAYAPQSTSSGDGEAMSDARDVARMIVEGSLPPTYITGRPTKHTNAVAAEIRRIDPNFNLTRAQLDYAGIRQQTASLNQSQQLRLRQNAENARVTAQYLRELIADVKKHAPPRSAITAVNKAQLSAIENGAWGREAAVAASKLRGQLGAWSIEMANVYSGGYAAQQEHLKQGEKLVNADWALDRIAGGLEIGERDTNIRLNAVNEIGAVSPSNPLVQGGGRPAGFNIGSNVLPLTPAAGGPDDKVKITRDGVPGTVSRKFLRPTDVVQ